MKASREPPANVSGRAGGRSFRTTSPSNDDPHRRVLGQPFSVVGILVARQTTVHRLPEKAHQSVLHVTTAPTLLQTLIFAVSVSPSASSNSRQASSPASEVMVAPRNSNRTRPHSRHWRARPALNVAVFARCRHGSFSRTGRRDPGRRQDRPPASVPSVRRGLLHRLEGLITHPHASSLPF